MIEEEKKEIIKLVAEELKSRKLLGNKKSTFEKTEILLYKFNVLPESIKILEEEIIKLQEESSKIPKTKSKSNHLVLNEAEGTYVYGDEVLNTRISELKQIIVKTKSYIRLIKKVLKKFEEDEYYPLIESIYFDKQTYDQISDEFGWATGTISKHKARLINELKVYIFPNSFIEELGN